MACNSPESTPARPARSSRLQLPAFDVAFPVAWALALALAGVFLQVRYFPIGDINLETDFYGDLVMAARHVAEGRFAVADFPWKGPVYALLLVPVGALTGDLYRGAIVLSAIALATTIVVAYRLLLQLFDRRVAVLSVGLMPLVVELALYSHRAATDVVFMGLAMGSMACSLLPGATLRRIAAAGALAALAFLTRYNGVFLLAGAALALGFANPDHWPLRRRAQAAGVYVAAFLIVCVPWFIACWTQTGTLLATRNADNVVATFWGGTRWLTDSTVDTGNLRALVTRDPMHFLGGYVRNLAVHFENNLAVLLGWPLAAVPIAGILGLALRPLARRQAALLLFGVAYGLVTGIVFYAPRFYVPMIPVLLTMGFACVRGGGPAAPGGSWRERVRVLAGSRTALWVAAAFTLATAFVQVRRIVAAERDLYTNRPLYLLEAARVLAGERATMRDAPASSLPKVMARKGHVAYHAGFEFSPYSTGMGSLEELVRAARSRGVGYVVYSNLEYTMLPRMLFMATIDSVPLLDEIHRGKGVRVFRLPAQGHDTLSERERYGLLLANLRVARQQRRPAATYLACEDLGRYHLERGEFEAAALHFEEALQFALRRDAGEDLSRAAASAREHLAAAKVGLGRPQEAIPLLEENLRYFETLRAAADVARIRASLAEARARAARATGGTGQSP